MVTWSRWGVPLVLAGTGGLVGFLAWWSLGWPLIHDAPLMHYAAWLIRGGAVPYRDVFDMNFPGVYLLHLLALSLFGSGDLGWRLFDLVALGGTVWLVVLYCRPFGPWSAASAGLLFALYHLAGGAWRAGQRDFLLCFFLLAGFYGLSRAWSLGALRPLALGALAFGVAVTVKPQAALLLPLPLWIGWLRARQPLLGTALALGGVGLPLAAVGIWLWWAGGLDPFVELVMGYLVPLYSTLGRSGPWEAIGWQSYGQPLWLALGALTAFSLTVMVARRRFEVRRGLLVLGTLYGIVHSVGQGKGWEYHLYPLALFALLLATAELGPTLERREWRSHAVLLVGVIVLTVILGAKGVEATDAAWVRAKQRRVETLAQDLAGRVPSGGTVQVLDTTEGGIHALFRLGIRQPTRFLYDFPLFHDADSPIIQRFRQEFLEAVRARPPAFVVVFEKGWPQGGYERIERFPEFRDWLTSEYRVDRQGDGYRIYEKRSDH
jgi:hypothetical protein